MMRGQHAGVQAAQGEANEDGVSRLGRIHHGERVRHVVIEGVGRHIRRPVGLAIAAGIKSDAAEALAEIR
jgi:hypothetical protein